MTPTHRNAIAKPAFEKWGAGAIVLLALFAYSDQLGFYFTDVDTFTLIETSTFHSFDELVSVLTSPMMGGQLPNALFYRPFSSLIWGLEEHAWGLNPLGYHITGLTLHVFNCLLLFSLMLKTNEWQGKSSPSDHSRLPVGRLEALAAAALLAIHPIAAETVPVIARRPDLLFCFFQLLALNRLVGYLNAPRKRTLAACVAFCVLSVASKDSAIIVPAIIAAYVFCFSKAPTFWERITHCIRCCVPILICVGVYVGLRTWVLGGIGGYNNEFELAPAIRSTTSVLTCTTLVPGYLDEICTRQNISWIVVALGTLLGAVAIRLRGDLQQPGARRVAFAALSIGLFVALYVTTRTAAMTRTIYPLLPFICIFLGWGVVDAFETATRLRMKHSSLRPFDTALRLGLGAAFIVIVGAAVMAGGRGKYLDEWREIGERVEETVAMIEPHIETLESGTRIYLVNLPFKIRATLPRLRDLPILDDYSIQGWADLFHPEKNLDIVGLTKLRIDLSDPAELSSRVAFNPENAQLAIKTHGHATIEAQIQQPNWGKRHPLLEIASHADGDENDLTIELTPEAFEAEEIVFLVYLGDRVELRRVEAWSVESSPASR